MNTWQPAAGPRAALRGAVLLAHVLLAWGLVVALGPTPHAPPAARAGFAPIRITLLAEPPAEPTPAVATTVRQRPSTRETLPRARQSSDAEPRPTTAPAPITLPAPAPVLPAERDMPALAAEPAPPASAPVRLDLPLPPTRQAVPVPSAAEQAVQAQVGNTRITRPEALLARRLEDRWTEELQDGRVVLRRGEDCVVLAEARALQLDPANNRGTMPRGAGSCAAR